MTRATLVSNEKMVVGYQCENAISAKKKDIKFLIFAISANLNLVRIVNSSNHT